MTCFECLARTSDYVDGLLDPVARAAHREHIRTCASCARYHRVLDRGLDLVRNVPFVEPSPEFTMRLHRRLRGIDEEQYLVRQSVLSGAAVTVALAGLIALAAWSPILRSAATGASGSTVATTYDDDADETAPADWPDAMGLSPYLRPMLSPPPSMMAAFPGPYSPLVVSPPAVGSWPAGRTVLTAYITE
ncbi:MAG: anti-sigma factor family protein [Longimicrobiales bacterium]